MFDGKLRRYSCKTKDKTVAQEVAAALNADVVRNRFDIPVKYEKEYVFNDVWREYLSGCSVFKNTIELRICVSKYFLPVFKDKSIQSITKDQIENYQLKRKLEIITILKNGFIINGTEIPIVF